MTDPGGYLAVEFVLIPQELTLASARRLPSSTLCWVSAGLRFIAGLLRVLYFEKDSL
jgi:uncharacterized membrane protein